MQTFRLPLIALLTILCVPIWALADGRGPDCYVLSVGISNYPRASKLNASLNDARSIATAFARQQGRAFGTVQARTLLDGDATRARISQGMRNFAKQGSAGDFFVVSLNGHGGLTGDNRSWHFYPFDHVPGDAGSNLTDKQILEDTDVLVKQGKKVAIIVDACYAGALRKSAQSYFSAYKNASGGLILMLSSGPEQTSAGLASYSPFAKALADGLGGAADLDRDGKVTLDELRRYSSQRTHELLRLKQGALRQDCEFSWSQANFAHMPLAHSQNAQRQPAAQHKLFDRYAHRPASQHALGAGSLSLHYTADRP